MKPADAGMGAVNEEFRLWWCEAPAGVGSVLARRRQHLACQPTPWKAPGDWRWCPEVPLPAPRLRAACAGLAGIWLGPQARWWSQWPAEQRRAALALGSTAPLRERWPEGRAEAATDLALAARWAWRELACLLEQALPVLHRRLHMEWTLAEGDAAGVPSAAPARLHTDGELARARRQWLAAIRGWPCPS
jgi:hypothetical protein